MREEFVMRGKTASGKQEVLNFSGFKPGMAYRLTELQLYPSTNIGSQNAELAVTITAGKTFEDPSNPNFNNEGLIAVAVLGLPSDLTPAGLTSAFTVVNDTFYITQNLILAAVDTIAGAPMDVNWQCRFKRVKMSGPEEAVTNYRQFAISNE